MWSLQPAPQKCCRRCGLCFWGLHLAQGSLGSTEPASHPASHWKVQERPPGLCGGQWGIPSKWAVISLFTKSSLPACLWPLHLA